MDTTSTLIVCWNCKHESTIEQYLNELRVWWTWLNVVQHICSRCNHQSEIQVENNKIIFGYLYAAGTAHFMGMEEFPVAGLNVSREKAAMKINLNGQAWHIPAKDQKAAKE